MEALIVVHEIFNLLSEQNLKFWSSIAQIVTSIVLVIAAIWTARIHHKNRSDSKFSCISIIVNQFGRDNFMHFNESPILFFQYNFVNQGNKTYRITNLTLAGLNYEDRTAINSDYGENSFTLKPNEIVSGRLTIDYPYMNLAYRTLEIQIEIIKPNGTLDNYKLDLNSELDELNRNLNNTESPRWSSMATRKEMKIK